MAVDCSLDLFAHTFSFYLIIIIIIIIRNLYSAIMLFLRAAAKFGQLTGQLLGARKNSD